MTGLEVRRLGRRLAADTQLLDQRLVPLRAAAFQVIQKATPPGDHEQEATTRVMVFLVDLEMFRQLHDPVAEERHLHFWRPGVTLVRLELRNYLLLNLCRQCHSELQTPRLPLI